MSSQLERKVAVELPAAPCRAAVRVRWACWPSGWWWRWRCRGSSTRRWRWTSPRWALFAVAVDLLLGYTGLLSFGHAAFWGTSAYATGLIAIHVGLPFPVAVLGGAVVAMLLAVPIGYLSVRRTGIYFAMVTLAFAQMVYFVANQWRVGDRRRERPAGRSRENLVRARPVNATRSTSTTRRCRSSCSACFIAWRIVHSPFGRVLVAIRDNPARARALGYPWSATRCMAFVLSAGLAGLAGGLFAISHGFASLQEVLLDHLRQGRDDHRPRRHRHAVGRGASARRWSSTLED